MEEYPHGHVTLLTALEEHLEHTEIVVIRGDPDEIRRWSDAAAKLYAPRRLVYAIPSDASDLPGALAERAHRVTARRSPTAASARTANCP